MKKILIAGLPETTMNYQDALTRLGASFCLPAAASPASDASASSLPDADALLLPGGGDIDPALFGEENKGSRDMDPLLDQQQLALLDRFIRDGRPVLGICKGMQLINIYFGGTLLQDLPTANMHAWRGRDQVHSVRAEKNSLLRRLYGDRFTVNSAHHQGIGLPGKGLRITLTAPDGVAEAIEHTSLRVLAVQWHPERMCFSRHRPDTVDGRELLASFLSLI